MKFFICHRQSIRFAALTSLLWIALVAQAETSAVEAKVAELRSTLLTKGYLETDQNPSGLSLLPPPPTAGSAAQGADDALAKSAQALKGSARWLQAAADADLRFPRSPGLFACALGQAVSEKDTPVTYRLLQKSLPDLAMPTRQVKDLYRRSRPFLVNGGGTCTPDDEGYLAKNGSYPSGHAAIGWGWALILAEAAPERADMLLQRGAAFAESRVVCNVHWNSDVFQGRMMAAALVARLHGNEAFRADLAAARTELARAGEHLAPDRDCAAEAEALKVKLLP